jgi:phytoene dehydrogenase-like protein
VLVVERDEVVGGGLRSAELTLPGFVHDVCASVHALAPLSPFFRSLPLAEHGIEWIEPPAPVAHPLDHGDAVVLERSVDATAAALGRDGAAYRRLFEALVEAADGLLAEILRPLVHVPHAPLLLAAFGLNAIQPATTLARRRFKDERARALFAGMAAHSILPLEKPATAAVGLVLGCAAHASGWPIARGGSGAVANGLAGYLDALGGEIETGHRVERLAELPPARVYLFDTAPRHLVGIAGDRLPGRYAGRLLRFRHGPGAFKVDWALDEPIPWRDPACSRAATVHLGGTLAELARSERAAWEGRPDDRPFVLLTQPSLFDPTRAPEGRHTAWAYCHVPHGADVDLTETVERQVERYAPGFRDVILARAVAGPRDLERRNPNLVGGDVASGAQTLLQLLARPTFGRDPYRTPAPGIYLCSASTPPGGGIHGMCGYLAARSALAHDL